MSQRYGLTWPKRPQVRDSPGRSTYSYLRSGFCKNNNKEFESDADKNTPSPQWTRKRSYILKLQKENKKKYCKAPSKPKLFNYNKLKKIYNGQAYKEKENKCKLDCYKRDKSMLSKVNNYIVWTNVEKLNEEYPYPSSSNTVDWSKISLNYDTSNWKNVRKTHIVKKFDRFGKEMLKLTGKLSKETIDLIIANIKENLQKKELKLKRITSKKICKKKTVSFIKKILQGTSLSIISPKKKYNLVRQSMRINSRIRPKLLYMKSCKTATKTKNIQTNTKSLYRSQSELLVKSTHALKVRRSYTILIKPVDCSLVNADRNLGLRYHTSSSQTDPSKMDFKKESGSKIISIFNQGCFNGCSEPEVYENIGGPPFFTFTYRNWKMYQSTL